MPPFKIGMFGLLIVAPSFAGSTTRRSTRSITSRCSENSRLIVGHTTAPIEGSGIIVEDGALVQIGKKGQLSLLDNADIDLLHRNCVPTLAILVLCLVCASALAWPALKTGHFKSMTPTTHTVTTEPHLMCCMPSLLCPSVTSASAIAKTKTRGRVRQPPLY